MTSKDFTNPKLRDESNKTGGGQVAPDCNGGVRSEFTRKRKRAYHRAIKRGVLDTNVMKFCEKLLMASISAKLCKKLFEPKSMLTQFIGLNCLVKDEL